MNKLKVAVSIIIVVVCAVAIIATAHERYREYEPDGWESHTVRTGETVWAICDRMDYSDEYDIRKIVDMVNEYNHIDGYIHPGDKIYLPVFDNGGNNEEP